MNTLPTLVHANTDFAIRLYQQLLRERDGESLFFSPISVAAPLIMLLEGARGQTADEMVAVLGLSGNAKDCESGNKAWSTEAFHRDMAGLLETLHGPSRDPQAADARARAAALDNRLGELRRTGVERERMGKEVASILEEFERVVDERDAALSLVPPYDLSLACALFVERAAPLRRATSEVLSRHYGAGVLVPSDFSQDPEATRQRINGWAAEHTRQRVQNLIGRGQIDTLTRLVLASAVYFKGYWEDPFPKDETREGRFIGIHGQSVEAQLMEGKKVLGCRYAAFNADGTLFHTPERVLRNDSSADSKYPMKGGFQIVELPYRDGDVSMLVLLPVGARELVGLERMLSAEKLTECLAHLVERSVDVVLPRFETHGRVSLNTALSALGMSSAFVSPGTEGGADFSGLIDSDELIDQHYISAATQRACIEVHEEGTEALAMSTMKVMLLLKEEDYVDFVPEFIADHPFLYMIRHRETGSILFMGRMLNPSEP